MNRCLLFNQPLDEWNVSSVESLIGMFRGCKSFNQPLNNWNVFNAINMSYIICHSSLSNEPLNDLDVSKIIILIGMFNGCTNFNQPLNNWSNEISNIINMKLMFNKCVDSFKNIR